MKINRSKESIYQLLAQVPDPEIPVVNIIEMGMIRDVIVTPEKVEVFLCPTYSGCPAMDMIESMVKEKLLASGVLNVLVTLVYKPAWTTDWMNAQTKEKLRAFGIAPPVGKVLSKKSLLANETVACPQCRSENTKIKSMFGSTACKALYTCSDCLEPFDYFKCI
ncbi:MAG: phenylacetate-CoA oxygenase subunit PaaJ [Flavobacteriales bacterium]|jgi:ring-1,2-phenylacetyl-CoA epoxidase subunit PaaD|nr:phenylacetate-CoA oxygenase subunit PaaJ [Flavobacteriales bacterium]|tara:strand:- start:596 stop:1087 length:492 start_codon:yes stop_codon:yes gene_type:complete